MGVSKNSGTPKSSILIGFSIINHPFWGTPIFGNTHIHNTTPSGHFPIVPQHQGGACPCTDLEICGPPWYVTFPWPFGTSALERLSFHLAGLTRLVFHKKLGTPETCSETDVAVGYEVTLCYVKLVRQISYLILRQWTTLVSSCSGLPVGDEEVASTKIMGYGDKPNIREFHLISWGKDSTTATCTNHS